MVYNYKQHLNFQAVNLIRKICTTVPVPTRRRIWWVPIPEIPLPTRRERKQRNYKKLPTKPKRKQCQIHWDYQFFLWEVEINCLSVKSLYIESTHFSKYASTPPAPAPPCSLLASETAQSSLKSRGMNAGTPSKYVLKQPTFGSLRSRILVLGCLDAKTSITGCCVFEQMSNGFHKPPFCWLNFTPQNSCVALPGLRLLCFILPIPSFSLCPLCHGVIDKYLYTQMICCIVFCTGSMVLLLYMISTQIHRRENFNHMVLIMISFWTSRVNQSQAASLRIFSSFAQT